MVEEGGAVGAARTVAGGALGLFIGLGTAEEAIGDVGQRVSAAFGGRLRFEQLYALHLNILLNNQF